MKLNKISLFSLLGLSMLAVATSCSPPHERRVTTGPDHSLAAAWQFACAITNDPADRAECQERVVLAYLKRGDISEARRLVDQIEGWRKGVVLAELAAALAEGRNTNVAMELVAQAESIANPIQDWQRDRIMVRAVKARALLKQEAEVARQSAFYKSNRDYKGEVIAYQALAFARAGQVSNALEVLNSLAGATNLDTSTWLANGYMMLAKEGHYHSAQTSNALLNAWAAAGECPGSKRVEVQLDLVETAMACNNSALAGSWLEEVSSLVMTGPVASHIRPQLIAKTAIRWSLMGQAGQVAECVRVADPLILQLQSIDQPEVIALLGEAYVRLGDKASGMRYYERALDTAEKLTNRRPRAIACVDICLSMNRAGVSYKQVEERLNRLLLGFGMDHG